MNARETLRNALLNLDLPLYRIEKDTGVSRAVLRKFLNDEGHIRFDTAEKLIEYVGYELRPVKKRKR